MNDPLRYQIWCLEIVNYLMDKHGYQLALDVKYSGDTRFNSFITLVNPVIKEAPYIAVTTKPLNEFDKEEINRMYDLMESLNDQTMIYDKVARDRKLIKDHGLITISVVPSLEKSDDSNIVLSVTKQSNSTLFDRFPDLKKVVLPIKSIDKQLEKVKDRYRYLNNSLDITTIDENPKFWTGTINKWYMLIASLASAGIMFYMAGQFVLSENIRHMYANELLLVFGGYQKNLLLQGNEWFRLFTYVFTSSSIIMFLLSVVLLFRLGRINEKIYQNKSFLIFIVGVLVGSATVFIINTDMVIIGLLNGIMALFGAYLVYFIENKLYLFITTSKVAFTNIILLLILMTFPNNSVIANGVSLCFGVMMGMLFSRYLDSNNKVIITITLVLSSCMMVYLMVKAYGMGVAGDVYKRYKELLQILGEGSR